MLSQNAYQLLKQRYLWKDEVSPMQMFRRVADFIGNDKDQKSLFFTIISRLEFLPNSPCLWNAGKKNSYLPACYILKPKDDFRDIMKTLTYQGLIQKTGGGVGLNFSNLRPDGSSLSTGGTSSGAVSWMSVFDQLSETIKQGGRRRSANMGVLSVHHPDIVAFITAKQKNILQNFNLSVLVDNNFMNAVKNDKEYTIINPHTKEISKLNAKTVFHTIADCAWHTGEPGIIYYENLNQHNKLDRKFDSVNVCAEVPGFEHFACILGSINLMSCVQKGYFNENKFIKLVTLGTEFLKNVIVKSSYPVPEVEQTIKTYKPLGLGLMGFADALVEMGIYYDSNETLKFIDEIGYIMRSISESLSPESCYTLSLAPTGSLSIIANVSSGIEPVFAPHTQKKLSYATIQEHKKHSIYSRYAHQISPEWHLKVLAKWQEWITGGISKTVNLTNSASVKEIEKIYMDAWSMKIKSCSVFRDGCREAVLSNCDNEKCYL